MERTKNDIIDALLSYWRAGHVCGEVQIREFIPQGGTVRCVARGAGADGEDLVEPRPI